MSFSAIALKSISASPFVLMVVISTLVILFLLALYFRSQHEPRETKKVLMFAALAEVLVFVLAVYMHQSFFYGTGLCSICKYGPETMEKAVAAYEKTAHYEADIGCKNCHKTDDLLAKYFPDDFTKESPSFYCKKCHIAGDDKYHKAVARYKTRHGAENNGSVCTNCHVLEVHIFKPFQDGR